MNTLRTPFTYDELIDNRDEWIMRYQEMRCKRDAQRDRVAQLESALRSLIGQIDLGADRLAIVFGPELLNARRVAS